MLTYQAICIFAFMMAIGLLENANLSDSCLATIPIQTSSASGSSGSASSSNSNSGSPAVVAAEAAPSVTSMTLTFRLLFYVFLTFKSTSIIAHCASLDPSNTVQMY